MKDNFSIQNWRMNLLTEAAVTPGESLFIDFHDGSIDEIYTDKNMPMLVQKAKQTMQALADQDNKDFPGEANTKVIENLQQGCYVAALVSDMETLPTACVVISPKYKDYKTMLDLASNDIHDYDLANMVGDIVASVMPESLDEVENEMPIGNREMPLGAEAGVTDKHQAILKAIQDMVMSGDHTILDLIKQKMQAEWGDSVDEVLSEDDASGSSKLKQSSKDVTVTASIKKGTPIDTTKIQQYVNELTALIQRHVDKAK